MSREIDSNIYDKYLKKPWYLHQLTISIMFAAWILIIPPIVGVALLIVNAKDSKKKRQLLADHNIDKIIHLDVLEKQIAEKTKHDEALNRLTEIRSRYTATKSEIDSLSTEIGMKTEHNQALKTLSGVQKELDKLKNQYKTGKDKLTDLEEKIIEAENEVDIQEVGFYGLDLDVSTSAEYKTKMIELQNKQKVMVKSRIACDFSDNVAWNNSLTDGKKMVRQSIKMKLWSFNTHCDSVITKVTYRNRGLSERKIQKAFDVLNSNDNLSSISYDYLQLKIEELDATFKYKEQLEHEKELLREQREQEREERKLQQEIARERAKIEKDETHINTELARLQNLLLEERSDKQKLQNEFNGLEQKLQKLNRRKEEVDFREAHAMAGYVYVISNVGAFGRDVIKIGVTRRLEPIERINELGDASVPFRFDVHALVFSDHAFKLEKALHDRFAKQRMNQVNSRKEFFKIPLEEVQKAIIQEFGASSVEFHMQPEAREFRQSIEKLKQMQQST